jgi:hypothetical protein
LELDRLDGFGNDVDEQHMQRAGVVVGGFVRVERAVGVEELDIGTAAEVFVRFAVEDIDVVEIEAFGVAAKLDVDGDDLLRIVRSVKVSVAVLEHTMDDGLSALEALGLTLGNFLKRALDLGGSRFGGGGRRDRDRFGARVRGRFGRGASLTPDERDDATHHEDEMAHGTIADA